MYRIVVDRAHSLVRLDMEGMLTPDEADRLVADLVDRIAEARFEAYVLVIDVSRCPVQAQAMIETMRGHLPRMKNARRVAIVTGAALVRLQVRRLFDQPFVRFADRYEEARAWVLSGIEPGGVR